ncbi:MAG: hypothetical protein EAZ85_05385 [Bacteroidetes bacterium]|nr:MAG: hypothetical protein EAZ85_05385 [Bacteroidota bacterium]TAG90079.1 MAG: hypothetical protein EAZ20_05190 [Bacteroidota bacterium]
MFACGSSQQKPKYAQPSPVDVLMRDLDTEKAYSIVLYDMHVEEGKKIFQHKYKVTKNYMDKDKAKSEVTDWKNVEEMYFAQNINNMGMELASKSEDGKTHKTPSPPGFNGVVGNKQYGEWKTDNSGNSFWAMYGQYAFMSSMIGLATGPVYRSSYSDYNSYRGNPNTANQPYYGNNQYGTNSPNAQKTNPNFFERKQTQSGLSSFRQKVESNPTKYSRSSSSSSSNSPTNRTSTSSSSSSSSSDRTSRSSSRSSSSSSSSSRSRGGSFGK